MCNPKHRHGLLLIVNPAHDAAAPDPVPPKFHLVSRHGLANISWVMVSGQAFLEKSHDPPMGGAV